jgi:hypothetical protein
VLLVPGLLVGSVVLTTVGAATAIAGLGAHLVSLATVIRHRRRRLELLHAFVVTAAFLLVTAIVLGVVGATANVTSIVRTRLISGEIAALFGWILLAVVGHAHKVVPFISWTALRGRGCTTNRDGGPLMFADLFNRPLARFSYVAATIAGVLLVIGVTAATPGLLQLGALMFFVTAVTTFANLVSGPVRVLRFTARQGQV